MQAKEHIDAIITTLEDMYGSPQHGNKEDPLDELIYIKLSQQTNAPKFRRMYEALQRAYPGWAGLENASQEDLETILRSGGFARQRAQHLRAMAVRIVEDHGELDLSWLRNIAPDKATAYLSSLPGVGIKTAYCVAMYSLDHDVLPVDVHVQRISERLEILPPALSDRKKHQLLAELIPAGRRYSYHVNCVSHGREVCRKEPQCWRCCLRNLCPFGAAHREQKQAKRAHRREGEEMME